mmetsp:Transcript_20198/g.38007  ORF Transcript_20198/g.38007 Transcript_20198/m.38007 type:complete len:81 (-) Transcript_20198:749-991(-)
MSCAFGNSRGLEIDRLMPNDTPSALNGFLFHPFHSLEDVPDSEKDRNDITLGNVTTETHQAVQKFLDRQLATRIHIQNVK